MNFKSLVSVLTLAICSCGSDEQGANSVDMPAAQFPSINVSLNTEADSDFFDCFDNCSNSLQRSSRCHEFFPQPGRTCPPSPGTRPGDWCINLSTLPRKSPIIMLVIHGGDVEQGTSQILRQVLNRNPWDFYDFEGFNNLPNQSSTCLPGTTTARDRLHITATHFDDLEAVNLVTAHSKAVAIHGDRNLVDNLRGTVCVGGRNTAERNAFIAAMRNPVPPPTLPLPFPLKLVDATTATTLPCSADTGTSTSNIVNRVQGGRGLQIELGQELRNELANNPGGAFGQVFYPAIQKAMAQ